ncbi:MDR family MFS transporter [Bifidobacterium xylocopae]|uniref:MDR family MFS transporter n=1 Tax=Bifidobacterium xylocopae TaxID=2493119 RepID=UPI001F1BCD86|nr:MDR family MFS transporter [Bifidobacterium xylocopae]
MTAAVFMSTFMTAVEGTIVSTAMPTIVSDLHGMSMMNWVFSIYMLMCAVTTPIYGKLSDRFGRKPLINIGLAVFVIGSLLCGLSQSMIQLILSRVVQGLGAGAIQPLTFTILADIFPIEKRAKMIGFNSSAWGVASIVAPLLGGFLVQQLSWHWVFAVNVPIGLLAIVLIQLFLKEDIKAQDRPVDYAGITLLTICLVGLMLGLQYLDGTAGPWASILPLVICVLACIGLIRIERRQSDPILPLPLFGNRTFIVQNMVVLLISGFLMGFETYLPIRMQSVLGFNPTLGGFALTPSSILWLVGSFMAGKLLTRRPPHWITNQALGFLIVGCIASIVVPIHTSYFVFLLISAVFGYGFGLSITIGTMTSQSVVGSDQVGMATSFNTLARSLGQTLMISVFGIVMNVVMARGVAGTPGLTATMMDRMINPETAGQLPARFLEPARGIVYDGLRAIFIVGLVILLAGLAFNLTDRRSNRLLTQATPEQVVTD